MRNAKKNEEPVVRERPQRRSSVEQKESDVVQATERTRVQRPLTRKEKSLKKRASKLTAADKKRAVEDKERYLAGKKAKEHKTYKATIWEKMIEQDVMQMFEMMGENIVSIRRFQRKRVIMTVLLAIVGVLAGVFIHRWLYLSAPIAGFFFYKMQSKRVTNYYRAWKFERQLNFSKFTRLIIPYLKAGGGKTPLYAIFTKILVRTEKEADKRSLSKLMADMAARPQEIEPFQEYAERSSGTDMSYLFMSTIFDFQQSTFDTSVIDELGQMAAEDMMTAIDEIIAMKLRRFVMFPTKVVLSSFILVAGLGAGLILYNFKDLDLGGAMIGPEKTTEQAKDASASADAKEKPDSAPKATPEEQMAANDAKKAEADAKAKEKADAEAKKAAEKKADKLPDWKKDVNDIANAGGSKRDKFYEVSAATDNAKLSKVDAQAFADNVRETYSDGTYIKKQGDGLTLANIYQAEALYEYYDAQGLQKTPMRQAAFDYWANAKFVFIGEHKADDKLIVKNGRAIAKNLAAVK